MYNQNLKNETKPIGQECKITIEDQTEIDIDAQIDILASVIIEILLKDES